MEGRTIGEEKRRKRKKRKFFLRLLLLLLQKWHTLNGGMRKQIALNTLNIKKEEENEKEIKLERDRGCSILCHPRGIDSMKMATKYAFTVSTFIPSYCVLFLFLCVILCRLVVGWGDEEIVDRWTSGVCALVTLVLLLFCECSHYSYLSFFVLCVCVCVFSYLWGRERSPPATPAITEGCSVSVSVSTEGMSPCQGYPFLLPLATVKTGSGCTDDSIDRSRFFPLSLSFSSSPFSSVFQEGNCSRLQPTRIICRRRRHSFRSYLNPISISVFTRVMQLWSLSLSYFLPAVLLLFLLPSYTWTKLPYMYLYFITYASSFLSFNH